MKKVSKDLGRRIFKKTPEELEQYMIFKRRGFILQNKRGKGSFKRKPKHPNQFED